MAFINHFIIVNIEVTKIKESIKMKDVKVTRLMDMFIIKKSKQVKLLFMVV